MTAAEWSGLITSLSGLLTGLGLLVTAVFSGLSLLQSKRNTKLLAENDKKMDRQHGDTNGRISQLIETKEALATSVERVAGDERTTAAVADERARHAPGR